MPAPVYSITAGNILEFTFQGTYQSQTILTVLHYRYDGPTTFEYLDEFSLIYQHLVAAAGSMHEKMRDASSEEVRWTNVRQQIIYPVRRPYHDTGTVASGNRDLPDPMPVNVAGVINKQTDKLARGRTGSMHLCGMYLQDQEVSEWKAAYLALLQAVANKIPEEIAGSAAGAKWIPVTWSRSQPANDATIIDANAMSTVRVMRRRTVRVGV